LKFWIMDSKSQEIEKQVKAKMIPKTGSF
jgi:hypothetical protein